MYKKPSSKESWNLFLQHSINFVQWLIFMGGLGENLFLYTSHKSMQFQCNCNQIVVVSNFSKVVTVQGGLRSLHRSGKMPK